MRLAPGALASLLAICACQAGNLSSSLSGGKCGPKGECAEGYVCSDGGQCVEQGSSGGAGGAGGSDACGGCAQGLTCCIDTCVDLSSDPMHCGDCMTVCPGTQCSGVCTGACAPGFLDCDGNIINGCEVEAASCADGG